MVIVISQISPQKPKFCLFQFHHLLTPNLQLLTTEIYSLSTLAMTGFLPVVTKFNYLGRNLNIDCRDNEDVVLRIKKAGNAFGALRKCLFSNPNISVDAKRAVCEGLFSPSYYRMLNHGVLPKSYFLCCVFFTIVV